MHEAIAFTLCAVLLASCASTPEYIEIRPECTAPPQPELPEVQSSELEALTDDVYWRLEDRERLLTDWALEMHGMLDELCGDGSGRRAK